MFPGPRPVQLRSSNPYRGHLQPNLEIRHAVWPAQEENMCLHCGNSPASGPPRWPFVVVVVVQVVVVFLVFLIVNI